MLKMISSPMKDEFPRSAGDDMEPGVAMTKEVEIYISPPPTYPPIKTEGKRLALENVMTLELWGWTLPVLPGGEIGMGVG